MTDFCGRFVLHTGTVRDWWTFPSRTAADCRYSNVNCLLMRGHLVIRQFGIWWLSWTIDWWFSWFIVCSIFEWLLNIVSVGRTKVMLGLTNVFLHDLCIYAFVKFSNNKLQNSMSCSMKWLKRSMIDKKKGNDLEKI